MAKSMIRLCVRTRRNRLHRWSKRDVAAATQDAAFYLKQGEEEQSEYWYGCDVWIETADVSPWRRVDLSEGASCQ